MRQSCFHKVLILLLLLVGFRGSLRAQTSTTFNYTGAVQTYTVPCGVTSVTVDVVGAQGGNWNSPVVSGGMGGRAQGTIAVTNGQVLYIYVGKQAQAGSGCTGYPGGGNSGGGAQGGDGALSGCGGDGGGGSSDIRTVSGSTTAALNSRLVVGAGGGGAAYNCYGGDYGGVGGGTTGGAGYSCSGSTYVGSPGTPTAGGAGGSGGGASGGFGYGGAAYVSYYGGGGGGGWYGGGGSYSGGGAGGSSYTGGTGVTGGSTTAGYRSGDGYVIITAPVVGTAVATPSTISFGTVTTSTPSTMTTFLTGSGLTSGGSLTITPPSNYQVSLDNTTFTSSLTYTYTGTSFSGTTLYVRFTPPAASSYSGNITITGGGLGCPTNIGVSGAGAAACSGTPAGGTAVASPTSGNSSTAFALSLTGATVAGGITYQWQTSPDNSTWTNVPGETSATYAYSGLAANTYFRSVLTCPTYAVANSGSALVTFVMPSIGCTPTASSWTSASSYSFGASGFTVTAATGSNLSDATIFSSINTSTGYLNRTATVAPVTLYRGGNYASTVTWGSASSYQEAQVWIDFNDNGTFESSEEVTPVTGFTTSSTANPTNLSISIPATASLGMHLMRVRAIWENTGTTLGTAPAHLDPCLINYGSANPQYYSGDAIDYKVVIQNPPPAITLSKTTAAFSSVAVGTASVPVQFFSVSGANLVPAIGNITVTSSSSNFLVSTDGVTWSSSLSFSYTGSSFSSKGIYVQFTPSSAISYAGSISFTGGGLSGAPTVATSGTGNATICSGTPTAGTAVVSPTSGGGTTVFSLSLTGATVASGLFYQWQSSSNGTTWNNIPDAIYATHTFVGAGGPFYRAIVTCGTGTPATSTIATVTPTLAASACSPTFGSASASCYSYSMYIRISSLSGVSGSITDVSGCNGTTDYEDMTSSYSVTLNSGTTYSATVQTGYTSYYSGQIWIDFNDDGSFSAAESVGGNGNITSSSTAISLIIPTNATPGAHRMRIVGNYQGCCGGASYPGMNSCPNSGVTYGDCRDYKVVISGGGTCSGTPTPGIVNGTPTNACSAFNSTLFNIGETVAGTTYQWQSSASSSSGFTNISGATNAVYAPGVASTTYYRNVVTCAASGLSANTASFQLALNSPPAAITGTATVCVGKNTTLANTTPGGSWTSSNTAVATVGSSNGAVTGVAAGTTIITYMTGTGAGCFNTAVVTVNALPTIGSVTPSSTSLCPGASLTLTAGSATGTGSLVSYNWSGPNSYNTTGTATTVARSLTAIADGGIYSLTVTYPGAGCTSNPATTSNITVSPLPTLASASNNGPICTGTTLSLSANTPTNVTGYSWSGPVAITGATTASATVPAATAAATGVYSVVVNNGAGAGCTATYTTSATVAPKPSLASATTSGTICANNTLNLSTSGPSNVTGYAWTGPVAITSSTSASATVPSAQTTASGVYTVTVNNGSGLGCSTTYTASATVQASSPVYTVTGGGAYCSGGTGVPIGLSGSTSGIQYRLYLGSSVVAGPTTGTGSPLSYGMQTSLGTYSISATNTTTGCVADMATTPVVSTSPIPNVYSVGGGGGYCNGTAGATVTMSASDAGVTYQLYRGSTAVGSLVSGTGSAISFAPQTVAGTYSVVANPGTTCATNMSGTTTIFVNGVPTAYNVTGGGGYCTGSGGTHIGLDWSNGGTNYQLYNGASPVGSAFAGTGAAIDFGLITTTGTYSVVATIASTGCQNPMTGTTTVSVNALPATFAVTGGGNYCSGSTGVNVGLSGSASGINYQLYNGSTTVGTAMAGTGSALDFGIQTAAGGYTVMATNPTTSCSSGMTGAASISVNALPTQYTVTGGGIYCAGGSGVHIFQSGSTTGVNYQLYNGATTIGAAVPGNGSSLDFGFVTAAGTYTVLASNAATSCQRAMAGSASVSINAAPTAYTVTGGGQYCAGGTGVAVGVNNSTSGVSYQLYNGATTVGAAASGTGSAISFGNQTAAGTYTVLATNGSTGCTGAMTGSVTVTVNSAPNVYAMTGGGAYCSGGTGMPVGVLSSNAGISYQLYRAGTTAVGSPVVGTGSAISFGNQTTAGDYTVIGTNTTTSCTSNMSGVSTITVNPLPTAYTVTGGGQYCSGGSGVAIGLSSSAVGTSYQLYNGATIMGGAVSGTGTTLSFGLQTSSGTYTVLATTAASCTTAMTSSATITINSLPTAYTVSGGGNYCAGGTGSIVGLTGSTSGVNYQLYNGVTTVGSPVSGTGGALSFGSQTAAGTYSVVAVNTSTTCSNNMSGGATVTILPIPTAFTVTGGGQFCSGGSGVAVGVSSSTSGVTYQLYNGSSPVGAALNGTGTALTYGSLTAAGTYTVRATITSNSCTNGMSGAATVTVNSLPTVYTVSGSGNYCAGGSGVHVFLSNSALGINYQLYNGSLPVGSAVTGSGAALDFGAMVAAGTYSVLASNATTGCIANMSGVATIAVDPVPTVYTITGGGQYCSGGTGVNIGLSGSNSGISYQLMNGAAPAGSPLTGTGVSLDFGPITTGGNYTILATNSTTGCTSTMSGSTNVTVNNLPVVYTITGGGAYCNGGTGVNIGLSGSTAGIAYQLYNGAAVAGSPVAGTGLPLDFGLKTAGGNYTVMAINPTTTCTNAMFGSANVNINANPTVYAVTGGGAYCTGGTGVAVGLSNSTPGVNYQLYSGSAVVGGPVAGTGSSISFGLQTATGSYTVAASDATTSCSSNMSGSAIVSTNANPNIYIVTGGGNYCAGGTGVGVALNGSNLGISYQLYNGATAAGAPVAGTGAAISFGSQTAAGVYNVVAFNVSTGCQSNMSGTASVGINAAPTGYAVTGGGNYCAGGAGTNVGLANSTAGIYYQLYNGTTPVGGPVAGTGAALDFGAQTTAGSYNVIATNASTSCVANMTGAVSVGINALPTTYTVSGGGNYCVGGTGVAVGLPGSSTGVAYQLYNGSTAVGTAVAGTGGSVSFGAQTAAGTYTVLATNTVTNCTNGMTGSAVIGINVLPVAQTVTGGGAMCQGDPGVVVGLGGSATGVSYQLYNGAVATGAPMTGTGGALSFGAQITAGTYSVLATNISTGCANNMTSSATIVVNPLPNVYNVTGGGTFCNGGAGVVVGIDGSNSGVTYQLYSGSTAVGTPASGGGSAISFGTQTAAGSYNVIASNTSTGCMRNMSGSATININPAPAAYTITGGGGYCIGGTGVPVGLSASNSGINYQLFRGTTPVMTVPGSGGAISFGLQAAAGTYTILATNTSTSCQNNMTGTATVNINPVPTAYPVLSMASAYCAGGAGVNVLLSSSEATTSYQLYNGSTPVGTPLTGTGTSLDFGPQTAEGEYHVIATSGATCVNNMTGSAAISINPLPTAYSVGGNGGYCAGSAGSTVTLSGTSTGISYQLFRGATMVGTAIPGTGAAISFPAQTTIGNYMVVATNTSTGCAKNMTGSLTVSMNALPTVQTVTGGGQYCAGGTGVAVGLNSSAAGINYSLYNGSTLLGTMPGTGSALAFGPQTASGMYSVVATNPATSCTRNMTGSATIAINPVPTAYPVTGGGNYCVGSVAGVPVLLGNSAIGVTYQLYNGTAPVGGFIAGTGTGLDFGMQSAPGVYSIHATDAVTLCNSVMSGSATINANPSPAVHTITGGGSYCTGGTGVHIGLDGSISGISYRLYNGATAVGAPMSGTGSALDFGAITGAGTYTVLATNPANTCTSNMNGSAPIVVNITVTPGVNITTGVGDTMCHGVLTTFTANTTNGGATPAYQWQVNGVNVGLGVNTFSYLPNTGDIVSVQMTSSSSCATPAAAMANKSVTVLASQMPVALMSTTPNDTTCKGTPVTLTVAPSYGGSAPTFTWVVNGGSVASGLTSYTYTPSNGDEVYVKMTSNYRCRLADLVESIHTHMTVDSVQVPVVALSTPSEITIAQGQTVTITATATKAGNDPEFQWYVNSAPVPGATTNVFTSVNLHNNDSVTCLVTNLSACAPTTGYRSTKVKMTTEVGSVSMSSGDIKLMPNPNKGEFIIRGTLGTTDDQELTAEVTNMLGQVVYRSKVQVRNGNLNERIVLDNTLANGMYMMSVRSANENKVFHFVLEQ